jgi:hypothetical protein
VGVTAAWPKSLRVPAVPGLGHWGRVWGAHHCAARIRYRGWGARYIIVCLHLRGFRSAERRSRRT